MKKDYYTETIWSKILSLYQLQQDWLTKFEASVKVHSHLR